MKIYFAPLEGVTGYVFRNAFHRTFTDADKYFIPFVAPHPGGSFSLAERRDLMPENNAGMYAVPQVMTKNAGDFLELVEELKEWGYREININAGCPSVTVVAKDRGAGLLKDPVKLDQLLDGIFKKADGKISVKTRLGMEDPEEFYELLKVYNSYPIHELIIHPRVRSDYYKNAPHLSMFEYALEHSKNPVVYNGDLNTMEDIMKFKERFPMEDTVMIGRGFLHHPGLIEEIKGKVFADNHLLKEFHDRLLEGYEIDMDGSPYVLFKMKEIWSYLGKCFEGSEIYLGRIRRTKDIAEYRQLAEEFFDHYR